jgi:hypothetical protein
MQYLSQWCASALLLVCVSAGLGEAGPSGPILEQRLDAAYNTMVLDVRDAGTPAEKKRLLEGFLGRMDKGMGVLAVMLPTSNPSHGAAVEMRARIQADRAELDGIDVRAPSAAGTLNGFASYLQQDVEQADGVYLSVGALVIILILVIILF